MRRRQLLNFMNLIKGSMNDGCVSEIAQDSIQFNTAKIESDRNLRIFLAERCDKGSCAKLEQFSVIGAQTHLQSAQTLRDIV